MLGEVYRDADYPQGLRCGNCDLFTEGMPISEQITDFVGDTPTVVLACVPCGLAYPVADPSSLDRG